MTIKELRKQTGLSQSKFAQKFNIPVRSIQKWERESTNNPAPYIPDMIEQILLLEEEVERLRISHEE